MFIPGVNLKIVSMKESNPEFSLRKHPSSAKMTIEDWLEGEELPITIWNKKYRHGNENFEQWLDRVSGGNEHIRDLIKRKKFIFAGRILSNRGIKDRKITYSNCYVLTPPEDSLESIFEAGAKLARTFSYGGGVGFDISKLRPKNAPVNNAARSTSGAVSFMELYSQITGLIGQEGRRGALMLSISCEHPDLIDFINLKSDLGVCTKANISVMITDEFMKAVENNEQYELNFQIENGPKITKTVNAKEVFMLLAKRNWEMAEPGILFWDRISNYNLLQGTDFKYAGVNPCGEEPLPAGGSCLLGSLNLSEFVLHPFTEYATFDFDSLIDATRIAISGLTEVLLEGLPLHPLQEQRESVTKWRQIGLGTLGLADMLIKMGIKYGSDKSLVLLSQIYSTIAKESVCISLYMAMGKGAFPGCTPEYKKAIAKSDYVQNLNFSIEKLAAIETHGLFHSQLLTCAPTGTIGTMLQVSTGVEPNFAFSYNRRTVSLNDTEQVYKVDSKIASLYKKITGETELPDYFLSADQIPYADRIKVQALLQQYIDASISSTVNLPNSATIEDVADLYLQAWKRGLKGVTIYRNGCQRQAILSKGENKSQNTDKGNKEITPTTIKKTSDDCIGRKRTLKTGCGTLHLTAFFDRNTGQLLETYCSKGSQGGCMIFMNGLSRMMSLAARGNISINDIVDQLKSAGTCPSYAVKRATGNKTSKGASCPVAIGYALTEMYEELQNELKHDPKPNLKKPTTNSNRGPRSNPICPNCNEELNMTEGCMTCPSCGYSKCS